MSQSLNISEVIADRALFIELLLLEVASKKRSETRQMALSCKTINIRASTIFSLDCKIEEIEHFIFNVCFN